MKKEDKLIDLIKEKDKSIKQMAFELKSYRMFINKLENLKNRKLMELERLGDDYPFKHYKIRKDEINSFYQLIKRNVPKVRREKNERK